MVADHIDDGTVAGYDIAIAISQETINRQLAVLYETEDDSSPANRRRYLVDHELHLHKKVEDTDTKQLVDDADGIDAYLCCPQVQVRKSITSSDQVVRVGFKFRKAAEGEVTDEQKNAGRADDSLFTTSVEKRVKGKKELVPEKIILNNWEISWEAVIKTRKIVDVMKELVTPAQNPKSEVAISKKVRDQLIQVNTSIFQVSTIFCAFESGKIAQTLILTDDKGVVVNSSTTQLPNVVNSRATLEAFLFSMSTAFLKKEDSSVTPGQPTSKDPFILGYTISQPKGPAPNHADTPACLVPTSFDLTTSEKDEKTGGALNFCMLTNRGKKPFEYEDDDSMRLITLDTPKAGYLKPTLFGSLGLAANPGTVDGILMFARDIIVNHWVGGVVIPKLKINIPKLAEALRSRIQNRADNFWDNMDEGALPESAKSKDGFGDMNVSSSASSDGVTFRFSQSAWGSHRMYCGWNKNQDANGGMELQDVKNEIEIKYENAALTQGGDENQKRRIKLQVDDCLSYQLQKSSFKAFRSNRDDSTNWDVDFSTRIWLNFRYYLTIGPSESKSGAFAVESVKADHLNDQGEIKGHNNGPPSNDSHSPGVWRADTNDSIFEWMQSDAMTSLRNDASSYVGNAEAEVRNALSSFVDDLKTTTILPAGDVFMFKGLACESNGNWNTIVNYDTPLGGNVIEKPAPDWSFSKSWVEPTPKK